MYVLVWFFFYYFHGVEQAATAESIHGEKPKGPEWFIYVRRRIITSSHLFEASRLTTCNGFLQLRRLCKNIPAQQQLSSICVDWDLRILQRKFINLRRSCAMIFIHFFFALKGIPAANWAAMKYRGRWLLQGLGRWIDQSSQVTCPPCCRLAVSSSHF